MLNFVKEYADIMFKALHCYGQCVIIIDKITY